MKSLSNKFRTWSRFTPAILLIALSACGLRVGFVPEKAKETSKSTAAKTGVEKDKPKETPKPGPKCTPPAASDEYKNDLPELARLTKEVEELKKKSGIELWKAAVRYARSNDGLGMNPDDAQAFAERIVKFSNGPAAFAVHVRAWNYDQSKYPDRLEFANRAAFRENAAEYLASHIRAFQFAHVEKEGLQYEFVEAREFAQRVASLGHNVSAISVFMRVFLFATRDPKGLQLPFERAIELAVEKACIPEKAAEKLR